MVSSTSGVATLMSPLLPSTSSASKSSTDSFAQQLVTALEGYLANAGDSGHFQIDIQTEPGQSSGTRQFIVTVRDADPAATATAPAASTAAPAVTAPSSSTTAL